MTTVELADIYAAQQRLHGKIQRTPMPRSDALSDICGCNVFVKLENLHRTGSFKERGALNKLLALTDAERRRGVIAASAGNHAQGAAYHARRLGIPAVIVMPEPSPLVKIRATREFGAEVILHGEDLTAAHARACELEQERGLVFVHPFDDAAIISGQGTLGLELLADLPDVDAVVVAVGGGGLMAGIGCAVKTLKPGVRLIGVQTTAVPSMQAALAARKPVTVPGARTIADGIAVRQVGVLPLAMAQKYLDELILVDDEEVASAILQLLEKEKTVAEGAGACPMAALLHRDLGLDGKNVVVVLGGGNINVNLIARIIERGLIKDGRRVRLEIIVPDRPGMLAQMLEIVAGLAANVLEVVHQRWSSRLTLSDTEIALVLETRGQDHVEELLRGLGDAGFTVARVDQ